MKTNVYFTDFREAFRNYDRMDNFSYNGLHTLYDYLIELEENCGNEIELDVIALCCEYSEYTIKEAKADYNMTMQEIENNTTVIYVDDLVSPQDVDDEDNNDCTVIIACF